MRQALDIARRVLGEHHVEVAQGLTNLAMLCAATDRPDEALELLRQAVAGHDRMIGQIFLVSSERNRLDYLRRAQHTTDLFVSLVHSHHADSPAAVVDALGLILRRKALSVEVMAKERAALLAGGDPQVLYALQRIQGLRRQIAQKELIGPGQEGLEAHQWQIARWQAEREALERNLAERMPPESLGPKYKIVGVVVSLPILSPPDSALIEFERVNLTDFKAVPSQGRSQWQPARYLAFVLPAGPLGAVTMIDLGEADTIDQAILDYRATIAREVGGSRGRDSRGWSRLGRHGAQRSGCTALGY